MTSIVYKEFYNKERGLPEPVWGPLCSVYGGVQLQCPTCGSKEIHLSGSPGDPEEILQDTVRCKHCGRITDWYEAYKQGKYHPTDKPTMIARVEEGSDMRTLNELVAEVSKGARRIDGQVMVDKLYDARCYKVGEMIRIDLAPAKPVRSAQGPIFE